MPNITTNHAITYTNTSTREAHKEKNNLLTTLAQTCQLGIQKTTLLIIKQMSANFYELDFSLVKPDTLYPLYTCCLLQDVLV